MEKLGRYTILRELGKGSRGQVYLARDPVIERDVVLKTLRTDLAQNLDEEQELFERFRREAKALGTLKHGSIVTIYDVARDEKTGIPYLAMEYVPGADLQSVTRSGMTLPVSQVADIGAQVAATLAFAHGYGIVHRDIKPSNLLLGVDGVVRIADFGIVKIQGADITQIGLTLGTPSYMSPEQIRGDPVDGRCDVFALGVVLYELLTGEKPFGMGTAEEMVRRVFQEHPVAPMVLRARVPRDLSSFVMRCLEKDPEDRWQQAVDLAKALGAVAHRERVEGASDPIAVPLLVPLPPMRRDHPPALVETRDPQEAAGATDPSLDPPPEAPEIVLDSPPNAEASSSSFDTNALVAEKTLVHVDPIGNATAARSPGNWLITALLVVIAVAGFALIVLRGSAATRLFGSRGAAWIFPVSEKDLELGPSHAPPTQTPPRTPTPLKRTAEDNGRLESAKRDMEAGRIDQAITKLGALKEFYPGDAEIVGLWNDASSRRDAAPSP